MSVYTDEDDDKGDKITIKNIEKDDEPEYVLDPFSGSGTVAVSAKKHGCDYIGFDFVQEYVDKANERIEKS